MANPAFRSSTSAVAQTASTFTVNKPAGVIDGDILFAYQATVLGGGTSPAAPTGWTLWDSITTVALSLRAFLKVASSEGSSWTFNNASGGLGSKTSVYVVAASGAPTDDRSSTGSGTGTTADAAAITTTRANDLLLSGWMVGANVGETITPHASWNALGTIGDTTHELNVGYKSQAGAGASSNTSATISGSLSWLAQLMSLKTTAAAAALFRGSGAAHDLNGLGAGGPFFGDPLGG